MKRFLRFLLSIPLTIICVALAESIVSGKAEAQRPPVLDLGAPVHKVEPGKAEIFPYAQPAIYDDWWHEIADCEGLELPDGYKQVQFFAVNATDFVPLAWPLQSVYAVTFANDNQIFMSEPLIWSRHVVTHEMTHWLLKKAGFNFGPWHPAEFFDVCGLSPWGK